MSSQVNSKEYSEHWAYDISKNVISQGELYDDDVIKQSIEMIVATYFGERLFNLGFGSPVWGRIFEKMSPNDGENLLNGIAAAIKKWENRVLLNEPQMRVVMKTDENTISLSIPYTIKRSGKGSIWQKKIFI
jgi:phage baseplate assembly protein W